MPQSYFTADRMPVLVNDHWLHGRARNRRRMILADLSIVGCAADRSAELTSKPHAPTRVL